MQCIVEVVRYHYELLQPFMEDVTNVTFSCCEKGEDMVKAQAIEVWSSIAEEEITLEEKNKSHLKLISTIFTQLKDVILSCIGHFEFYEDMNDRDWGTSTSAASCLKILASLMKDDIVDPILDFAGPKIVNNNPKEVYVGLLTLGTIVEGPKKEFIGS